jgi:hypothetical protein
LNKDKPDSGVAASIESLLNPTSAPHTMREGVRLAHQEGSSARATRELVQASP